MAVAVEPEKEKRGKLKKWVPKKWRPEYDRIVGYSVMGQSNIWIAATLGFKKEHVSVILNTPQGIEMVNKLQAKLKARMEVNIPETLSYVAQRTAERLKEVLDNQELFEKNPFAVIDRGMDVLKGLKHLSTGPQGGEGTGGTHVTNIGAVVISTGQKSDIMDGLAKIAEVKRLHGATSAIDGDTK